jgi:phosphopantothenoylcysteine decarboxylase / phosphopantothenate---cysteine ligase
MSKILIGVTGGIAAYKAADIVSVLVQEKHEVKVIMTENAKKFITPLTLATLSKNPVFDDASEWTADGVIKHIELSKWADLFVIVPATANTIQKIALGTADNLLTSAYLAFELKVLICPAMNTKMWNKKTNKEYLSLLRLRGNKVLDPEVGMLACGDEGMGKLPATRTIIEKIKEILSKC